MAQVAANTSLAPAAAVASATAMVPRMLTSASYPGWATEAGTPTWAARWMPMAPGSPVATMRRPASRTSSPGSAVIGEVGGLVVADQRPAQPVAGAQPGDRLLPPGGERGLVDGESAGRGAGPGR